MSTPVLSVATTYLLLPDKHVRMYTSLQLVAVCVYLYAVQRFLLSRSQRGINGKTCMEAVETQSSVTCVFPQTVMTHTETEEETKEFLIHILFNLVQVQQSA